jgi:hypothetical protein
MEKFTSENEMIKTLFNLWALRKNEEDKKQRIDFITNYCFCDKDLFDDHHRDYYENFFLEYQLLENQISTLYHNKLNKMTKKFIKRNER